MSTGSTEPTTDLVSAGTASVKQRQQMVPGPEAQVESREAVSPANRDAGYSHRRELGYPTAGSGN
jgi:hypothetical protein